MYYFLTFLGRALASLPDCVLSFLCRFAGFAIWAFPSPRMRLAKRNIRRCFPNLGNAECSKIAMESSARMVEMALFVLASPYLPEDYLRSRIKLSDYVRDKLADYALSPYPAVLCIPHFSMMETITMFPIIWSGKTPETGVIYRPFDSRGLEKWVKKSRERFGLHLISRRNGIGAAFDFLQKGGCVAVLFDQESGRAGVRGLFMDRVCSTSNLHGILAERSKSPAFVFYARRTGFWSSEICGDPIEYTNAENLTAKTSIWLENKLKSDAVARYDWLWLHKRWKSNCRPYNLFQTDVRHEIFDEFCALRGWKNIPRGSVISISMPDEFSKVAALIPVLKALRKSRFDASLHLFCKEEFASFLSRCKIAEKVYPLSKSNLSKILFFWKMRATASDIHAVFDDSPFQRFCAWLMGSQFRVAITQNSNSSFWSSWVYRSPASASIEHISFEYENFLKKFGMDCEVDCTPMRDAFPPSAESHKDGTITVAFICGSDSSDSWGVEAWAELASKLSANADNLKFAVYGNAADSRAAYHILRGIDSVEIEDKTQLRGFSNIAESLVNCDIAVASDVGIAHLANAVGVPVVGLYGDTNPLRNGFVFDSPKAEVLPPSCPPQGGVPAPKREVDDVVKAFNSLFQQTN